MAGRKKFMAANDAAAERNGSGKHWTKAEREARIQSEVKPQSEKKVMAPKWLEDKELREEFYKYAAILKSMDVGFCQMDADFLGWYLTSRKEYNACSEYVREAIFVGDSKQASSWVKTRNTLFAQAKACAGELGLTIDARCNLVAPEKKDEDENPLAALQAELRLLEA